MTRRRWIADVVSGNRAALLGAQAQHLARVLRARIGQEFDIAAEGRVRRGHIVSITPEKVEFELGKGTEIGREGIRRAAEVSELTDLPSAFRKSQMACSRKSLATMAQT